MNDYKLENSRPTSTGNQLGYYSMDLHSPQWSLPIGPVDPWEEALADDKEMFPRVHIHVSEDSRDCDGGHGNYYVMWPTAQHNLTAEEASIYVNASEMVGTFDADKFWRHAVKWSIGWADEEGSLIITRDRDDDYHRTAIYSAQTDEGFHATELRMCTDDGCDTRHTVYDQYAELAGY